jgi:hypothetical protein
VGLFDRQTSHGLVQQQHAGASNQSQCQIEAALFAVAQVFCHHMGHAVEFEFFQHSICIGG